MSWQQQLIHHVKGEQRRHSIIGKSLPCFGEGEVEKAPGMTHEAHLAGGRQRSLASGYRILLASHLSATLIDERALSPATWPWSRPKHQRQRDTEPVAYSAGQDEEEIGERIQARLALHRRAGWRTNRAPSLEISDRPRASGSFRVSILQSRFPPHHCYARPRKRSMHLNFADIINLSFQRSL